MPHVMFGARPRMLMSRRLVAQAGEYERAVRKYDKALRYIDQGGFLGEDKVQVPDAHHLPPPPPLARTHTIASTPVCSCTRAAATGASYLQAAGRAGGRCTRGGRAPRRAQPCWSAAFMKSPKVSKQTVKISQTPMGRRAWRRATSIRPCASSSWSATTSAGERLRDGRR